MKTVGSVDLYNSWRITIFFEARCRELHKRGVDQKAELEEQHAELEEQDADLAKQNEEIRKLRDRYEQIEFSVCRQR